MSEGRELVARNMTSFFNRELMMYSIGDIRLKSPISLRRVILTSLFGMFWSVPFILIFGLKLNLLGVALTFGPPVAFGVIASRPIFFGRNFFEFLSVMSKYVTEPKGWSDLKNDDSIEGEVYSIDYSVWISRRRELELLSKGQ